MALGVLCSTVWLWRVPFFQQPDESAHADYAFALFDAGRPFRVRDAIWSTDATPEVRYLKRVSDFRAVRYSNEGRVPEGYGSATYFRGVDAAAPRPSHAAPPTGSRVPYAMFGYPAGYYVIAALVMTLATGVTHGSLVAAFFAVRAMGVALFAISLVTVFFVLRAAGARESPALIGTAALALFPLAAWVSAYIQPDTLVLALVSPCLLFALRWRARPFDLAATSALSATLVALAFVKPVYAGALIIPCVALVASYARRRSVSLRQRFGSLAAVGLLPVLATFAARYAVPVTRIATPSNVAPSAVLRPGVPLGVNVDELAGYAARALGQAYLSGPAFRDFWMNFGWNGTPYFRTESLHEGAGALLGLASAATIVLMLIRCVTALARLWRIVRRRSPWTAMALVGRDVVANAYVVWSALVIAVFAVSRGTFAVQGRYWLPVIATVLALGIVYVPRLVKAAQRRRIAFVFAGAWLAYGIVATPFSLAAMESRFYRSPGAVAPNPSAVAFYRALDLRGNVSRPAGAVVKAGDPLLLEGWAIGTCERSPVVGIGVLVDGRMATAATYGIARRDVADDVNDDAALHAGFRARLNTRALRLGRHSLRLIAELRGKPPERAGKTLAFDVVP